MEQIYINVKNATGTIIGRLDVGDKADINTVYSLADVREPDKKQTDYIETFTIPGTKNNNTMFQHLFENGFSSYQYNPTLKLDAQVIVNGNQYFSGSLQVNKVHKIDDNNITGYDITIYGPVGGFFAEIDKYKITDLVDLSDFKHTYNIHNIAASWDAYIWQNGQKVSFQLGNGYVYPMEYRGQTDAANWNTTHFKPAIYVKTIFDRILKSQGFTYNSRFLSGSVFSKLILPYCGEETIPLSTAQVDNATVFAIYPNVGQNHLGLRVKYVDTHSDRSYTDIAIKFSVDNALPARDDGNNYNPSTGILTIPKNGNYTLRTTLYTNMLFTNEGGFPFPAYKMKIVGGPMTAKLRIVNVDTGATLKDFYFEYTSGKIAGTGGDWQDTTQGGVWIEYQVPPCEYTGLLTAGSRYQVRLDWTATKSNFDYKTRQPVYLGAQIIGSKEYQTNMSLYVQGQKENKTYDPYDTSRFELNLNDKTIIDGDQMDINWFLPNIKASEFINDINKMFNLYWKQTSENEFVIEPRDDFYKTNGTIRDWTYMADNKKEVSIEPLYDLQYKKYKYTYADDSDYYNNEYKTAYMDAYGTKNIEIESDFVDGELKTSLTFAATPTIKHLSTNRILPAYVKKSGTAMVYAKPKQRILFYGGRQPTSTPWKLISNYETYPFTFNDYPFAGHFDNPTNPLNDLNWGVCKVYYNNWNKIINNNLFNKYWRSQLEEMTDINGHLLTVNMILDDIEMINFDIRRVIQFENVYYRVNKLTHNPLTNEAVVELIKMKDYTPFTPSNIIAGSNGNQPLVNDGTLSPVVIGYSSYPVLGYNQQNPSWNVPYTSNASAGFIKLMNPASSISPGVPVSQGSYQTSTNILAKRGKSWGDELPASTFYSTKNANTDDNFYSPQAAQEIMGRNNNVSPDARSIKIQGDNNNISSLAMNVSIVGDNNTVLSGVSNVSVVGNNQTISRSNVSYFHGTIIDEDGFRKDVSIIKSPTNSAGMKNKVIRGGMNSVKSTRIIKGGQDRV